MGFAFKAFGVIFYVVSSFHEYVSFSISIAFDSSFSNALNFFSMFHLIA